MNDDDNKLDKPRDEKTKGDKRKSLSAGWIAVGVALGCAIGLIIDNLTMGIAVGISIGIAMDLAFNQRN